MIVHSLTLAAILRQFGNKSHEKHLPMDYLNLSELSIIQLLRGLFRGDGCRTKDGIALTTSSITLAVEAHLLLRRLGILASVRQNRIVSGDTSVINGRLLQRVHSSFRVDVNGHVDKLLDRDSQLCKLRYLLWKKYRDPDVMTFIPNSKARQRISSRLRGVEPTNAMQSDSSVSQSLIERLEDSSRARRGQ